MPRCENCGVELSLPTDRCQECGHPLQLTFDPMGTSTDLGPGGHAHTPTPQGTLPDDDAAKVERLLGHIAGQSHFEERYILRGELARGGMGQVHRGYDQILRREVAVKMMHERYGGSSESAAIRGQFLKEARVGGRLLHPNILAVFDLGVNRAGRIYYTMRLVDGASLQHCLDAVDKGVVTKLISYPLRRIVEAFVGACQGVDYAHQQGVIHLDLKPHNILVSGFNEVFVIDWGLARVDERDDTEELADLYRSGGAGHNTASNTGVFGERVIGTPGYMAPEQTRGEVAAFDPATDVYGLGGILHFILYGIAPNQGRGLQEVMQASAQPKQRGKLRGGILPRGQRVRKEARAALEALEATCLKALEPRQEDRYASVEAMIVELGEWLSATPGPPLGF
ncbi:Serine/threonine-protein kinase PknB [Aquisphaera giovannonii]|uniref:Serine/threonine-protein kinase PknB n=1 Tax=Aquisphaera giovannonii TaxID=406548 RepID=A0A5B9VVJ2_9BACT|nr:serine/threonine-protein kinase [Aquisphaera giovannonii]QEH31871.1 Serine/threonine-protein kinase PknB [Aquisphaera giovannonii]